MAANALGNKFICFMCQCKFYDLNRPTPICPKCGANQKDAPKQAKPPATRARAEKARAEPVRPPVEDHGLEEGGVLAPDDDAVVGEPGEDVEVEDED